MRTRIMNQLQAAALTEGYRWWKKLFSEQGRAQLEKLVLAPWASRRRKELLKQLDQLDPKLRSELQQSSKKPINGQRDVVEKRRVNLLDATVRYIEPNNDAFLNYSSRQALAVVLYLAVVYCGALA
jgi:hypothetical protein